MLRLHKDNLTGEHRAADIGQLALFVLFMALWISDTYLNYSNFLNGYLPLGLRLPFAVLLLILSAGLGGTGLWMVFVREARSQRVIKKSVFRFVRHPIYLSEIIYYLGLLLVNISLAAAFIWIIAMIFLHYIARYEEKLLLARSGEEYAQYMREVPMWFPRLFRNR